MHFIPRLYQKRESAAYSAAE